MFLRHQTIFSVSIATEFVIFISFGSQIASITMVGQKMSERSLNTCTTDIRKTHCFALVQA